VRAAGSVAAALTLAILLGGAALAAGDTYQAPQITRSMPDWRGVWVIDPNPFDGTDDPHRAWNPPYTAAFQAKVDAKNAAAASGKSVNLGDINCLPDGMPHMAHNPYPNEFVIGADRVVIINEFQHQVRIVYTDGRPHQTDPDPSYNGDAIGHWEGDTLVVDTTSLRADTSLITSAGQPHSDKLHLVERIRRVDADFIEDQITMDDPVAFTRPWVITYRYKHRPDWTLQEFICEDNNRSLATELGGAAPKP
jgi:hypothetical protein